MKFERLVDAFADEVFQGFLLLSSFLQERLTVHAFELLV